MHRVIKRFSADRRLSEKNKEEQNAPNLETKCSREHYSAQLSPSHAVTQLFCLVYNAASSVFVFQGLVGNFFGL